MIKVERRVHATICINLKDSHPPLVIIEGLDVYVEVEGYHHLALR